MTPSLNKAWEKRLALMAESKALFEKAEGLAKDRFSPNNNAKISLWYAAMVTYYEWMAAMDEGRIKNFEADTIWHDAVVQEKGNIRADWQKRDNGWACQLETGELFEP